MGRLVRLAVAATVVTASFAAVRRDLAAPVDEAARDWVASTRTPPGDRFIAAATDIGSVYGMAGAASALTAAGKPRVAVDVLVSGTAAWTAAQAVKPAMERLRPYELGMADRLVERPAGSSWPSGHAAVAAAIAAVLAPRVRRGGQFAVTATAAAVGISRLYVGVHHLTDVVAGWGIGFACGALRWPRRRKVVVEPPTVQQ
ncbi:MAG: phosphatase PAP2 family protein [Nitriliruptoraceae bacterium]